MPIFSVHTEAEWRRILETMQEKTALAMSLTDPEGKILLSCWKTKDVPRPFAVQRVPCNMMICSDRTYLEYSDLPCLVQDSKIIIDIFREYNLI